MERLTHIAHQSEMLASTINTFGPRQRLPKIDRLRSSCMPVTGPMVNNPENCGSDVEIGEKTR